MCAIVPVTIIAFYFAGVISIHCGFQYCIDLKFVHLSLFLSLNLNSDDRAFIHGTIDLSSVKACVGKSGVCLYYVIVSICPQKQLHVRLYYFYRAMVTIIIEVSIPTAIIAMNIIMLGACMLHLILYYLSA